MTQRLLAAVGLLAGSVLWTAAATLHAGLPVGQLAPLTAISGTAIVAGVAGALLARWRPVLPVALLCASVMALTAAAPAPLDDGPLSGPLGYANADAALYVQLTAIFLVTAAVVPGRARWVLASAAVIPVIVVLLLGDRAAGGTGSTLLLAAWSLLIAPSARAARLARTVTLGAVLVSALFAPLVALTGVHPPSVDSRRLALWHDGVAMVRSAPLLGHGARSFPSLSPTARSDADTRETHAEPLQIAAEGGLPAAASLVASELLLVMALTRSRTAPAANAAMALGTLCLQAGIDYVQHFPVVVAANALVVGAGLGLSRSRSPGPATPPNREPPPRESPG